jgi:hypothetical protein
VAWNLDGPGSNIRNVTHYKGPEDVADPGVA